MLFDMTAPKTPDENKPDEVPPVAPSCEDVKCFCAVVSTKTQQLLRASTCAQYIAANRAIAGGKHHFLPLEPKTKVAFVSPLADVNQRTVVGAGCVVGASSTVGEKCGLRNSIIGKGCTIHAGAKVINSVLMEGVTIMSDANVSGCIICSGCTIKEGVKISNCRVGNGCVVEEDHDKDYIDFYHIQSL